MRFRVDAAETQAGEEQGLDCVGCQGVEFGLVEEGEGGCLVGEGGGEEGVEGCGEGVDFG